MHSDALQGVKQLLVVSCDRHIAALIPALSLLESALQQTSSTAQLTLLTLEAMRSSFPSGAIEPTHLSKLKVISEAVSVADWDINPTANPTALMHEGRRLIHQLGDRAFDAAIIFTTPDQSPYTWGYLCYLAGIPIRIGQSQEFGGGVLSLCIAPPLDNVSTSDYYLHLVRSLGFLIPEKSPLSLISQSSF